MKRADSSVQLLGKFSLIAALTVLSCMSLGDILVDLGEGESLLHVLSEGFLLIILTGVCCYTGWRVAYPINPTAERRIVVPIFICLLVTLCLLTADDVSSMITGASETSDYVPAISFSNNLHEVIPQEFYRSGEMSYQRLQEVIKEKGIKTVVDLRLGADEPDAFGRTEADYMLALGVNYYHIGFQSSAIPPLEKIHSLLTAFDEAVTPILVHCSSGTHRSGFASALWVLQHQGGDRTQAIAQLSPRYGFFRFERRLKSLLKGAPTLDDLIWYYVKEAQQSQSFRDWVNKNINRFPTSQNASSNRWQDRKQRSELAEN